MKRFLICALALAILMTCCFGCSRPAVKSEYASALADDEVKMISRLIDLELELCKEYGDKDYFSAQSETLEEISDIMIELIGKFQEKSEKAAGMPQPDVSDHAANMEFIEALDKAEADDTPEYREYSLFGDAVRDAYSVGLQLSYCHINNVCYSEMNDKGVEELRIAMTGEEWTKISEGAQKAYDNFYK